MCQLVHLWFSIDTGNLNEVTIVLWCWCWGKAGTGAHPMMWPLEQHETLKKVGTLGWWLHIKQSL